MVLEQFMAGSLIYTGVWDFVLPFMLVFAIIYAILQKVKIFGSDGKKTNVIIAMVMGLLVVVPHALGVLKPWQDPVVIMQKALPQVSIIVVAILMALLIIGILGKRVELGSGSLSGWIAFIALIVVAVIFKKAATDPIASAQSSQQTSGILYMLMGNPELMGLVVMILVFAIIIWFITHEAKEPKSEDQKFGTRISKLLKGSDE